MLAAAETETVNSGFIFWGSLGMITVAVVGLMGCIPTKKSNTENTADSPNQETGEPTSRGRRACQAWGTWLTNVYNITCFTNSEWPCWKTILIKAVVMFLTTLGSALASLAITRVFADDEEDFEDTVARVVEYVLGDTEERSRRDTSTTDGTMNTDEMATILTAAVICVTWTAATITVLVTYVTRKKEEVQNQVELGPGDEDERLGDEDEFRDDQEMEMNEHYNDKLEVTICDGNAEVDNERRGHENWISDWIARLTEPILNVVIYIKQAVMGRHRQELN